MGLSQEIPHQWVHEVADADVERGFRGPQLVVSRGNGEFVEWLFRAEVPEMDKIVLPMRQRLQARGESLTINANFVDFKRAATGTTYQHKTSPAEYAELVLATYQHMQSKYGFVPDAWEVILEPDVSSANWTPTQVGQAIKAAGDRLAAAGFTPRFIAPSTTNGKQLLPNNQGGNNWIGQIAAVPGAMQYIDTFAYHRYTSPTQAQTQIIAGLGAQYGKKTAMLEWIGADYNTLHMDLKDGNNSSWQQFTLASLASWGDSVSIRPVFSFFMRSN
jgi:hypothetical protein